jgi:hypothetical protein
VRIILALLVPIISALVYGIVRFWGEEEPSKYPLIDKAWEAGIKSLESVGISLSRGTEPLFLVLGSGAAELAFAEQMQATGQSFRLQGVPGGNGVEPSLRWYATDSAIFLFVSDVGALATLARGWTARSHEQPVDWATSLDSGQLTMQARHAAVRQHVDVTVGAMDLGDDFLPDEDPGPRRTKVVRLPIGIDFDEQFDRIRYLSRLIKRARRPRCGLNGVAVLLPLEFAVARDDELTALVDAIRNDVRAIHHTLSLRFPVVSMVIGMEQAVGFKEFANLLGRQKAMEMRLGSEFSVHRWATAERLQWLSDRICDNFEDFVYARFKLPSALENALENCKLYHFLCRVRQQIKPQLYRVLSPAFRNGGRLTREEGARGRDGRPAIYFGGCYFAGTGRTPEEGQAFVKGVLSDKLKEYEHRVEWTDDALRAQARLKLAVWTGWIMAAALLVLFIVQRLRS